MKKIALVLAALAVGWTGHVAAGGKGTAVELDGLKSTAPAAWKAGTVESKFRVYEFKIPKADGDKDDAELVIFHFGEGGGGGVAENLKRWKGMLAAPPGGKTIDESAKVDKIKVGDVPTTVLDVSGTYLYKFPPFAPNAKITPKENYRLIGVVFESPKGPYFFRLTGPAKTVEANKKGFDEWIKAFK